MLIICMKAQTVYILSNILLAYIVSKKSNNVLQEYII